MIPFSVGLRRLEQLRDLIEVIPAGRIYLNQFYNPNSDLFGSLRSLMIRLREGTVPPEIEGSMLVTACGLGWASRYAPFRANGLIYDDGIMPNYYPAFDTATDPSCFTGSESKYLTHSGIAASRFFGLTLSFGHYVFGKYRESERGLSHKQVLLNRLNAAITYNKLYPHTDEVRRAALEEDVF